MANEKTDEEIQRDVLAELKWDARVLPNEIGVAVKGGVVTLTGNVDSFYKKWAAEDAAHRVRGVKAVANDIKIVLPSTSERTDDQIAASAANALAADALLASRHLQITVSDGWVTVKGEVAKRIDVEIQGSKAILKGTVRSWAERDEAERTVWTAPGITQVEDKIQVSYA